MGEIYPTCFTLATSHFTFSIQKLDSPASVKMKENEDGNPQSKSSGTENCGTENC